MADLCIFGYCLNAGYQKISNKERFENKAPPSPPAPAPSPPSPPAHAPSPPSPSAPSPVKETSKSITTILIIGYIFYLIIAIILGIWAVKLSWRSNSLIEWDKGYKIFFAFFAFLGGFQYLVSHLIFKADLLSYIRKIKPVVALAAAPIVATAVTNPEVIRGGMQKLGRMLTRK